MKKPYSFKKEQSLYIETGKQKVLEVLFRYPEREFSLSDLAKEAGVAKANIGTILDELYKNNIIRIEKLSKIWRIRVNQGNWNFVKNKIVFNLGFIFSSGLVEYLSDYYKNPKAIILFGSFRRGEDISTSDIDIAIEVDDMKEYLTGRMIGLRALEETIARKIQIHQFNRKSIDINLFNNIANGIVLSGFLEVRP
ncbi:MAG TPA: nucleotidyltransferase domain-containing protein [archaeon]|nr:nucleotidyltransferase domain-containing protein [archaeon]